MAARSKVEWTAIYETPSPSDADLVRTTLELAGYRVSVQGGPTRGVFSPGLDTSSRCRGRLEDQPQADRDW